MRSQNAGIGVFILAKNEITNIGRNLSALARCGWDVHVLDSGSTDGTQACAETYENVHVVPYAYVDHCTAYNEITSRLALRYRVAIVLDADMVVTERLRDELLGLFDQPESNWDALKAPIAMCVEGQTLQHGSLCPPKVFALRTGKPLFVSTGHAEKLKDGLRVVQTNATLIHDDRKEYSSFLLSQARYAGKLAERYMKGEVSGRDRLRVRTPLLIAIVPAVTYFLKGGFLSGQTGVLYALDRLIAEAIMYRQALVSRMTASDRD